MAIRIGTAGTPIDPHFGALADNGGPTMTHQLLTGSPAIEAGDPAAVAGVGNLPVLISAARHLRGLPTGTATARRGLTLAPSSDHRCCRRTSSSILWLTRMMIIIRRAISHSAK